MEICEWALSKLQEVRESPRVLVRDPLGMLENDYGEIGNFARTNGFTVITAATNLAFRDLYEKATADPEVDRPFSVQAAGSFFYCQGAARILS
jgi:hypothetical protein